MLVQNRTGRGTFLRAHSLARHLVRRGHEVTILAGAEGRSYARTHRLDGVEIIEAWDPLPDRARESGLSPFELVSRLRHLRRHRYDLLHCFEHRPAVALPSLRASRRWGIPCVMDWCDLWGFGGIASVRRPLPRFTLGLLDGALEERVRRGGTALTVINTALAERARARCSVPVHLLPGGADSDVIVPLSREEMRRRHGLPPDAKIAVHTGLAPYDAELLAESFARVAAERKDVLLLLTGRPLPVLDRILAAAGLSDRVIQAGFVSRTVMGELMACGDAMLLPYSNRPVNVFRYPHKLGGYLAAGRPIVTNFTGDLGQLVREEQAGLTTADCPGAFAHGILSIFEDAEWGAEMGKRGRNLAESKLDWRFASEKLERIYLETLGTKA